VDEEVHINEEGHTETKYIHREAVIQFGNVGDSPLHPTITFLITGKGKLLEVVTLLFLFLFNILCLCVVSHKGSKVDMRRYLEGDEDTLHCETRRYSTGGIVMRWPITGAQDHDVWFTCTIRHTQGLFAITTFLRHTPTASAGGQVDYLQWITVNDRDLLTTSGTGSPS